MPDFEKSLPMLLNYTLDAVMPAYRHLFAKFDLTEQQWRVLRVLWQSERETVHAIATRTLLPKPSLVGILDRLEKKELVARVRSVEDRRNVYVVTTAAGRALQTQVLPLVDEIHAELKGRISADEWEILTTLLAKLQMDDAKPDVARGTS